MGNVLSEQSHTQSPCNPQIVSVQGRMPQSSHWPVSCEHGDTHIHTDMEHEAAAAAAAAAAGRQPGLRTCHTDMNEATGNAVTLQ